ncbi:MAG: exodeoxyribonuclease VII large subunit [Pseudomonadota bacterium]
MTADLFDAPPQDTPLLELTVSDLALGIKKHLETGFSTVRVRGELSRIKIHSSGHLYSDLKDENAVINMICWRTSLARLAIRPEEGLEVICTGRITTYPARSNYQLVVETMELAGQGALLQMLERRKQALAAEGLFNVDRKKPLPVLPQVIGIITSPTGAVIKDILHRLQERCPAHVLLWPVRVQGESAEAEITAAIRGFSTMSLTGPIRRPDVLIVARGGGSLEDLMPFNAESVVRAVADCPIPVISAIGHETDTTLIDYVADQRAPTPTAAAEMAVPRRDEWLAALDARHMQLSQALRRMIREAQLRLQPLHQSLQSPARLFENRTQALDTLTARLPLALRQNRQEAVSRLAVLSARLPHPRLALDHAALRLSGLLRVLSTLSVESVLARGFALVRDGAGQPVTHADALRTGQHVTLQFAHNQSRGATITDDAT